MNFDLPLHRIKRWTHRGHCYIQNYFRWSLFMQIQYPIGLLDLVIHLIFILVIFYNFWSCMYCSYINSSRCHHYIFRFALLHHPAQLTPLARPHLLRLTQCGASPNIMDNVLENIMENVAMTMTAAASSMRTWGDAGTMDQDSTSVMCSSPMVQLPAQQTALRDHPQHVSGPAP